MKFFWQNFCNKFIILVIFLLSFLINLQNSAAQILDSEFYGWRVYEIQESELDYKKCYIASHPITSESDHNSRQRPYLMIARFQKDRVEEVSISSGYEYKLNSVVKILIDEEQFRFVAKKDLAWAASKSQDLLVINKMLQSGIVKVRSDAAIGAFAVDEYSMKGVVRAYARMREICQ